jgi:hypothetical protein
MKTAEEIVQDLQEIITNIYLHPAMYGRTPAEVEQAFWIYHRMWAYATEQEQKFFDSLGQVGTSEGYDALSPDHIYRQLHPQADDHEVLAYVLKCWAMTTKHLGIPLPIEYPDPAHCFLPYTE